VIEYEIGWSYCASECAYYEKLLLKNKKEREELEVQS